MMVAEGGHLCVQPVETRGIVHFVELEVQIGITDLCMTCAFPFMSTGTHSSHFQDLVLLYAPFVASIYSLGLFTSSCFDSFVGHSHFVGHTISLLLQESDLHAANTQMQNLDVADTCKFYRACLSRFFEDLPIKNSEEPKRNDIQKNKESETAKANDAISKMVSKCFDQKKNNNGMSNEKAPDSKMAVTNKKSEEGKTL